MKKDKPKTELKTKRMQSASAQETLIDMREFIGEYSTEEMKGVLKIMKQKIKLHDTKRD